MWKKLTLTFNQDPSSINYLKLLVWGTEVKEHTVMQYGNKRHH